MRHLKSSLTVVGAVTVLALAGNTVAQAATGHSFVLGKTNSANTPTTLVRTTAGAVLSLKGTSASGAPLAVNGKGKVTNLNADLVDGYNSTDMRNRTYLFTRAIADANATASSIIELALPTGTYELGYSAFPRGTFGADDNLGCYFTKYAKSNGSPISYVGEDRSVVTAQAGVKPAVSGTAVVQITSSQAVKLECWASASFSTFENQPIQVWASPTAIVGGSSNLRTQAPREQLKH